LLRKSTKFVLEFCGLDPLGIPALIDIATLSCFNRDFLRISARAPCAFIRTILSQKLSAICVKEKFLNNTSHIHLTAIVINYHDRNNAAQIFKQRLTHSPIAASSLFGGNPFMDGILGHNLLLSRAFSVGIPSWMGF
jgi:hypothetical protein